MRWREDNPKRRARMEVTCSGCRRPTSWARSSNASVLETLFRRRPGARSGLYRSQQPEEHPHYPPAQCEAGPQPGPCSLEHSTSRLSPIWGDESCGWAVTTTPLFHCKRGSESTPSNTPTQQKLALAEGSGLAQATTGFAHVGREGGAVGATTGDILVTTGVPGRIALSAAAQDCDNATVAGATEISQCVPRSVKGDAERNCAHKSRTAMAARRQGCGATFGSTMTPMAYCATGTGFRTSLLCVRK